VSLAVEREESLSNTPAAALNCCHPLNGMKWAIQHILCHIRSPLAIPLQAAFALLGRLFLFL